MTVLSDITTAYATADIKAANGQSRSKQMIASAKSAKAQSQTYAATLAALQTAGTARGLSAFMTEGLVQEVFGLDKNHK